MDIPTDSTGSDKTAQFWLGDSYCIDDFVKMGEVRRAVANFVSIICNKDIIVKFFDGKESFTDGKTISLGCDLSTGEIDYVVGLALHEASHIAYSDIPLMRNVWQKVPNELYSVSSLEKGKVATFVSDIYNYIESRYVDAKTYEKCPGYRGYYTALYNKVFNNQTITDALKSGFGRTNDIESYTFRIFNLTNSDADMSALPGLDEIHKLIGYDTLERLVTPNDRLAIACEVAKVALKNITKKQAEQSTATPTPTAEKNKVPDTDTTEPSSEATDEKDTDNNPAMPSSEEEQSTTPDTPNSAAEGLATQRDYINGTLKKSTLFFGGNTPVDSVASSNMEANIVGGDSGVPSVASVFVRHVDAGLLESGDFPFIRLKSSLNIDAYEGVVSGMQLGSRLGEQLQLAKQSSNEVSIRKKHGRIYGRLLYSYECDNDSVFFDKADCAETPINIILSIDASMSMVPKWKQTIQTATAIAKAASMLDGVYLKIMLRSGVKLGNVPVVYTATVYDSSIDPLSHIKEVLGKVCPAGSTPDGLAYESVWKEIYATTNNSYETLFVTISDGEPYFVVDQMRYFGEAAIEHTKKQVDRMIGAGISVLSYLVTDGEHEDSEDSSFNYMYGASARIIDVQNMTQIAETINKKIEQEFT